MNKTRYPCFWMYVDSQNEWRWTLYLSRDEAVAFASEGHPDAAVCRASIERLLELADVPIHGDERKLDWKDHLRLRMRA